ncbi:MAG TPA: UdgX family uracil-DNA binding protein, partial [Solirubrobacterales bacterium]|nr:UdgX family uracil-DNA binding protein [Solirubrobacterales bacterium]
MSSAADFLPEKRTLAALASAAAGCRGCPLYADATQTVFGSGRASARLMLVGEQPGDKEDQEGEPFVGPAGRILTQALEGAGIDRGDVYLTNAVKHFKWRPRGKRRLHQTPRAGEVEACRPWLEAELDAVRPIGLLALGATAAKA